MISHTLKWMLCSVVLSTFFALSPVLSEANSVPCFECHSREEFKGKFIHAPVAERSCEQCHNPHTSKHEGLLKQSQEILCLGCHDGVKERLNQSKYVHPPLQKGGCTSCHAPHKSEKPALLRYDLAGVCYDCHDQPDKTANGHQPFVAGQCGACHDPHSSSDFRFLKRTGADLCLGCHTQNQKLVKKHLGRDLKKIDCLSCHNPHGSDASSLIRSVAHEPFAEKSCDDCHDQKEGSNICLQCHEDILPTFNKTHSHLRGNGDENLCLNCHNPHAGDRKGLLPKNMGTVCRSCHEDTFIRREESLYTHVDWETCTNCHSLHGSDQFAMLKDEPDKVCSGCHAEHAKFTHPLGDDAIDPRIGHGMTCVSCHDPNVGTQFIYFLRGGADKGLCLNCHKDY